MFVWSRQISPEKLDPLLLALADLDATCLVVVRTPGRQRQLVQYFCKKESQAVLLCELHGGSFEIVTDDWQKPAKLHPPIRIRSRLIVVAEASPHPEPREIVIPAGLAFGTGDHPTTASCLRFLCDVAKIQGKRPWTMLDAGTGSGVLAIAAKKLGANSVAGFDFDSLAIRTAAENARSNGVPDIFWSEEDLQKYSSKQSYDVVAANIFSELFLGTWHRLRPAVSTEGWFILSGILRFQAAECRHCLEETGFTILQETRLGKWVTFLAKSSETPANLAGTHITKT